MKLNLGSGEMLKKKWINFDAQILSRGGVNTNVVGMIEDMPFKENSFDEILCSHVIEHFYYEDALQMMRDIHRVLKPGGVVIMEGPCVLGVYWYYIEGWGGRKEPDVINLIHAFYPRQNRDKYGDGWFHRSGWTGCYLAQEMVELGYKIRHVGKGWTHGMGKRDFRVEGIKV